MSGLVDIIVSQDSEKRNTSLESLCAGLSLDDLLAQTVDLDRFRRRSDNLYHRVRALFFLSALHRYVIPSHLASDRDGHIPFHGHHHLLERRFSEAIEEFLAELRTHGPSEAICSSLAFAYHQLAFQTLADQVRRSVRTVKGNQWMFRIGHPEDHPLRLHSELLKRELDGPFPVLAETTAVRMDFSHSAWSDIFFLGMDFPEGAQVLNVSINLGVRGRDAQPKPPIECYLRVIDRPVFRLVSVDLETVVEVTSIAEMFDFARDYAGLLKAAVIASGIVPPGMEGCGDSIETLLTELVGPGLGLELVSKVNDIPKGSRLAVSTNLLGGLISLLMRATRQVSALEGPLAEEDRRIVAARAILGEWLGGSGGGWQDSGGVWPGIKLIQGAKAQTGDPEEGISRGRLLPKHTVLDTDRVSLATRDALLRSLVVVHGGMAQNVGPILEMVTEKYLLRGEKEWAARLQAIELCNQVVEALEKGDLKRVGKITTENFEGPLQAIIPWATNRFTDLLIERCRAHWQDRFWGFWMLGGMSGGGMGFIFDPEIRDEAATWLGTLMKQTKRELESSLPFAMEPVVYDIQINDHGSSARLLKSTDAIMPERYYSLVVPGWLRVEPRRWSIETRRELERLGERCRHSDVPTSTLQILVDQMLPKESRDERRQESLHELLERYGFDRRQHEQIRADFLAGRIGLAANRLSSNVTIEDVHDDDVVDARDHRLESYRGRGESLLKEGRVGVVTLAAGVGSRWTEGAGVVKALHPFAKFHGRHRNFLEVHLAKSQRTRELYGCAVPHAFTTGYLTDGPMREYLKQLTASSYDLPIYVSAGRAVGLRMIPTVRDLRFAWEEMPQQALDEQRQKVRDSLRAALIEWARGAGEAEDYTDNLPAQCLHPVGHWYEVPNMLRNGTLAQMLAASPQLEYLLLHNIDTLGADLDPCLLGWHANSGACLSFEVIGRRLEDRGGGLARVNGRPRLVEGLAMPNEQVEFELSYYNSMTTWISIDPLLRVFGLTRKDLSDSKKVDAAILKMALRMPTYVTLKDVKKRWGHGQEDVFPIAQFEKLWGDMTALPDVECRFLVTEIRRGQQLKHQAQLDGWLRDGSAAWVDSHCAWND